MRRSVPSWQKGGELALSRVGLLDGHRQSRRGGGGVERGGDPWVLTRLCWRMKAILEWYNAEKRPKRAERRRRPMSMYPRALEPIPEETVRVARAACPK